MDKEKECKICSKRFSNGKAMGGHMRSHSPKFSVLHNSKPTPTTAPKPTPMIDRKGSMVFRDRQSKGKRHRDEHWDDEAETALILSSSSPPHSKLVIRKQRLKRHCDDEAETSILSSLSMEEDAALCLLMMKREGRKRMKEEESTTKEDQNGFVSVSKEEFEYKVDEEEEEEDSLRWKFKCKKCKKTFSSYQALGGHNASHRRMENYNGEVQRKVFKCSFCSRVFVSGQALGGHKKVHFSNLHNNNYDYFNNSQPHRFAKTPLDLNRPSPYGDYDEENKFSEIFNP